MRTSTLHEHRARTGAALVATLLAVAMLALAPTPARADGTVPGGTTKVMTATNESGGSGLALNDVITISFDAGETPAGTYFDTWLCTGTSHAPRDDEEVVGTAAAAGCTPFLFWDRSDNGNATLMSFRFGLADTGAFSAANLGGSEFNDGMPGLESWFADNIEDEDFPFADLCEVNGLYFIVHDYAAGDHSNFLGPLSGIPCQNAAEPVPPVLNCTPDPAVGGGTLTCEVTGGEPDFDILWRAAFDGNVFASTGVRPGPDGVGSFSFSVPREAACGTITVELVDWLPPMSVNVACPVAPTSVPAGEGPAAPTGLVVVGLLAVAGAAVAARRLVTIG